jgi:uncharacterized OB-fold protein
MNIAQNWRMNGQRYALKGNRCAQCGAVHAVPRTVCPECQSTAPQLFNFAPRTVIEMELTDAREVRQAAR